MPSSCATSARPKRHQSQACRYVKVGGWVLQLTSSWLRYPRRAMSMLLSQTANSKAAGHSPSHLLHMFTSLP